MADSLACSLPSLLSLLTACHFAFTFIMKSINRCTEFKQQPICQTWETEISTATMLTLFRSPNFPHICDWFPQFPVLNELDSVISHHFQEFIQPFSHGREFPSQNHNLACSVNLLQDSTFEKNAHILLKIF
jgi:hypothetical protein